MKVIAWYSGGITSTIATRLALEKFGGENVEIIFFETGSHHPDNERFNREVEEKIFQQKIRFEQSEKYKDIYAVFEHKRFINGPSGAPCTNLLKKDLRLKIEKVQDYDFQVFGFEFDRKEINRAIRFKEQYPNAKPIFPLIEAKLNKKDCVKALEKYGVQLPEMYRLGYTNNNCLGCIKGGMGYWNKIRHTHPDVFERMAKMERKIGATCLMEGAGPDRRRLYLDELDPERGRMEEPITGECGVVCATEFNDIEHPKLEGILTGNFTMADLE